MAEPLPGPAQAPSVYYRDYFADAANDVFNGNYESILEPYGIPAIGEAATPASVRTLAQNCKAQNIPTAFLLLHNDDNLLHIYIQLEKFHPRAGMPETRWDERMFISKGELHHNSPVIVEFREDYFNQIPANVPVPSPQLIDNGYAADPAANLLGPNDIANDGIVNLRVRRTCFVPAPYVPLFLANPLTPRQAWEIVRSQIVTDNRQDQCLPLINYLRCAICISTNPDTPILAVDPPIAPLPDSVLLDRRRRLIENDFPVLNANLANIQHTQIAGQLGQLVTESRATREAETARRTLEKNKPPTVMLGPVGTIRLSRYCQVVSHHEFPPFWVEIARNPKSQHLNILQWEINRVKDDLNEPDLQFLATAAVLEVSKSLMWEMTHPDAVTTGLNVFLLAEQLMDDALSRQQMYEMLHGDGAAPTLSDAAALLKTKAGAPTMLYHARQQIRRLEILIKVLIGVHHPIGRNLNAFCNRMISNEGRLHLLQADHLLLPTMLCKKIAVPMSNWFKNQVASAAPVPAPNFVQVFDDIEEERPWEPVMSTAFLSAIGLSSFRLPTNPTQTPRPRIPPAPTPNPISPPVILDNNDRVNNIHFATDLFSPYKDSAVQCRIIRNKIRNNELPALPLSKADNKPMCIAWHCKSMCNANCGRKADHIQYTPEEYEPLVAWCRENFSLE
jgi:hypothetical protein